MATLTKRLALVVDDDPDLQSAMCARLVQMDFEVVAALHYEAAVLHLSVRRPHLVCIDVGLPTQSGYELCEHIRGPLGLLGVPILMTCDSELPEDMANAEMAGANAFLKKPFSMHELGAYVEALVNPSRAREAQVLRLLAWP